MLNLKFLNLTTLILLSYQVANIMELMTMDKYKVEFAKFAFGRTMDKDNFRTVKETLNFSSSKKQIESLIQREDKIKDYNLSNSFLIDSIKSLIL